MRGGRLFLFFTAVLLLLSALTFGSALAQTPTITITSPTNGDVLSLASPVGVTGLTSSPPAGAQVKVTLFAGPSEVGTLTVVPSGTGSWSANVPFSIVPAGGSDGAIRAELLDGSLIVVAVEQVGVTWGVAQPPTATPTATATLVPPTNTPTATVPVPTATFTSTPSATVPGAFITVNSPTNGQVFNPANPVPVSGASGNAPAGATVLVRVRTTGGVTLGEQGIVPDAFGNYSVNVAVNPSGLVNGAQAQVLAFLINNGTTLATSNVVTITWQTSAVPTVVITSPVNGANINSTVLVPVSGTHLNLTPGTVIRAQAYVGNPGPGQVFVGEAVVNPNPNGTWSANIQLNQPIPNNTFGSIQAIAQFGSGIVASSNTVTVNWTSASGSPILLINSPAPESLVAVGGAAIPVTGFAANIPGPITVRAVDALGAVLSQQIVPVNPNGSWQTTLVVNTIPGARGGIVAISSSPRTSARVNVTYGAQCLIRADWFIYIVQPGDTLNRIAARTLSTAFELAYANCIANADVLYVGQQLRIPRQPVITWTPTQRPVATATPQPSQLTVRIDNPAANSDVPTDNPVVVRGGGTNLAGQDLSVRALDSQRRLLAQGTARADAGNNWQTTLAGIVVDEPTPGIIVAFIRSGSGVILGSATIQVTFQPTGVITADGAGDQRLIITTPGDGDLLTEDGDIFVIGTVSGGYNGEIRVRALDPSGVVIDEQPAEVTPLNDAGDSLWQASLRISAAPGTYGTIFAYAPSPLGINPSLADTAYITFGVAGETPYVFITSPSPYSVVNTNTPIVVRGQGGRLFEGNVVVRVLDTLGSVLAETATTVNSPNAGTGGEGPWEATLNVNVTPGTRGTIAAFSTSAQDGSIVAFSSVNVILGAPESEPNFVTIQTPLIGSPILTGEPLLIAGTADVTGGNRIRIRLLDENGAALLEQVRTPTSQDGGPLGVWQLVIELAGLPPGAELTIQVDALAAASDTVLGSDAIGVFVGVTPA